MRSLIIAVVLLAFGFAACGDGTDSTAAGSADEVGSDGETGSDGDASTDGDANSDGAAGSEGGESPEAAGGWTLQSGTVNGEELVLVPGYDATLELDPDGSIGGTASCNGYGGTVDLADGRFVTADLFSTEMGCEQGPMTLERQFIDGLLGASNHEIADGDLRVFGDNVELWFVAMAPVPESELVGTEWIMDTRIEGLTASTVLGRPTLLLDEDGTFTGSTGCRTLTGTWQISDVGLSFPSMAADGECDAEFAEQDGFVISTLEGPMAVEVDGPRLLISSSGEQGLGYRADLE